MIGYVTLGTNDLPRATEYYDRLLGALGAARAWEGERGVAWSTGPTSPGLGVIKPFDGQPATRGNGTMISLAVDSQTKVNDMHKLALDLGGTDEGAPGIRQGSFYAAYCRDLDGNKLCFFNM